ncbi:glycosyltransferase family 15 protein [Roridomyces roridus]|uniref:Glycosyltransferase family 15 protein n=1 Tax=Roridomyces roridus TaxID=1738132 RepID=A0AAD7BZR0_9AGAR|nr:glycosyltransferase family 15 protein [Roridomyces roridus]
MSIAYQGVLSRRRYVVLLVVLMSLFYFLQTTLRDARPSSWTITTPAVQTLELQTTPVDVSTPLPDTPSPPPLPGHPCLHRERANATLLMLARNSDLAGAMSSVSHVEDRFNKHCNYSWVFLNEEPFSDEFKREMSNMTNGSVSFGLVPKEHWYQPQWINEDLAKAGRDKMVEQNIIYAESVPYRNMCRFNSGYFFKHALLQQYRYYWRVEPDIEYFCDIPYDPFHFMQENDKIYGFTISFFEWQPTIPTLWANVKDFMAKYPQYVADDNAMNYLSDDGGETYNLCHFWSNFEIADMDFWRGPAYTAFFDFLESRGGFYYERWGDAPVHSIAVALFAPKTRLHFFKDIGYRHTPFQHCPQGPEWKANSCNCEQWNTLDYRDQSCIPRYQKLFQ